MLSLGHASLLLLAPLGILGVIVASRTSAQTLGRARRIASLAVRCAIVLLLTFALGGPVYTRIDEFPRFTAFLLDCSESVAADARAGALRELKPRWDREVAAGHRCALIAFAGHSHVVVPPSKEPLMVGDFKIPETLDRSSTDLNRALETARTLFRESAANRIVLLTDGLDSTRPAREIEWPPGTLGVPLADPARLDLAVVDVQAPLAVRAGEPFDLRVTVTTTRECEFGLSAVVDKTALPETAARFRAPGPGRHVFVLPHLQQKQALPPGLHELLVLAGVTGDSEPRNNLGVAAVSVTGKPKVLLVEGSPKEGEFLARVLRAQDIDFTRRSPVELASTTGELDEYVAVVLAGVARQALPAAAVGALRNFVENAGGGLWVVGSSILQGPQGYAGSDLEKILPVTFSEASAPVAGPTPPRNNTPPPTDPPPVDPDESKPQKVLAPAVALLLIVDKSGSMAGRNIEIVKETCIATAEALSKKDVVGVLAFDVRTNWVLEFTQADKSEYIKERILRLYANGGTHIYPALVEALRAFQTDPQAQRCSVKHAVLLSDGDTPAADFETVCRKMAQEGITLSTVCVAGPSFNPNLMSQISSWGQGRFLFSNSFSNVRKLILQDTQQVIAAVPKDDKTLPPAPTPKNELPKVAEKPPDPKPDAPEKPLPVVMKEPHEALAGIDGRALPALRGRLGAAARPKVEVPLATADGHPVLAFGRLGLGKTAVWASDLSGPWGAEWLTWKDSPKLFAQLVRSVSGSGPDAELAGRVRVSRRGSEALLRIDPAGAGGAIAVLDAAGRPLRVERDAQDAAIVALSLERPGELARLLLQRADGKKLALGAIRAYDEEFAPAEPSRDAFANGLPPMTWDRLDAELAGTRASGERPFDLVPWLIVAALLLLPLDVALRRITLS